MPHHGGGRHRAAPEEVEGAGENVGKSLYCGFHEKGWVRQGEKFRID